MLKGLPPIGYLFHGIKPVNIINIKQQEHKLTETEWFVGLDIVEW